MAKHSIPFAKEITNLRSDKTHGWSESTKGRAPHKPFLLLSVLDGIESGWISGPHIELSNDLVDTFYTYWNAIMRKDQVTTIALPFFHMKSEPFWDLVYKDDATPYKNTPSVSGLQDRVSHTKISEELFQQFVDPEKRNRYRHLLLTTYFDDATIDQLRELISLNKIAYNYSELLLEQVNEPFEKYASDKEKRYISQNSRRQVRDKGFRRAIRRIYQDTCALCQSRVVTQNDESLIEGAHIIPWENNGTDDPRNGLALCGTHHWLFDRYLYTLDDNYQIVLSNWLKRKENRIEDVVDREGMEIYLPDNESCYPAIEALVEHREKFQEINN